LVIIILGQSALHQPISM